MSIHRDQIVLTVNPILTKFRDSKKKIHFISYKKCNNNNNKYNLCVNFLIIAIKYDFSPLFFLCSYTYAYR